MSEIIERVKVWGFGGEAFFEFHRIWKSDTWRKPRKHSGHGKDMEKHETRIETTHEENTSKHMEND